MRHCVMMRHALRTAVYTNQHTISIFQLKSRSKTMPELLNARHERFCALIADGKSAAAAYEEAGYHPHNGNAYALRHREDVSARISELLAERQAQTAEVRERAAAEAQISASRLAAQLAKAYEIAEKAQRSTEMVNATVAQAKFAGLWVERSEVAQTNEFVGMDLEGMRRELVMRARRLGLDRELAGLLEGPRDGDQQDDQPVNGG
jgi:hypothetical protein